MPSQRRSRRNTRVIREDAFTILKRGTRLYTGDRGTTTPGTMPMFLTPHRRLAKMYANLVPDGEVFAFTTSRTLRLLRKNDVPWALGRGERGEDWEGFGSDDGDFPVARALCRRRAQGRIDVDGWIYKWSSPTLGEVLLCAPKDALRL